ncbi:hypothetical protein T03_1886 [Trichinella britovi]|uniref:Uncharacterized protein n=1 Tax=Trichinella britovi TaxID=45882 RepID=A0A0V1CQ41_TRIBR|nr:hypothetical protein T03_1886 [Trichinella britovi]
MNEQKKTENKFILSNNASGFSGNFQQVSSMNICNVVIENSQQHKRKGLINRQPLHISMAEYSDGFGQWILCIYKITWNTRRLEMITQTQTNYMHIVDYEKL